MDIPVIIIGAGHAGLCVSYFLHKHAMDHLVFEQGKIGQTWRSQRWDSFRLNSANKLNLLPGQEKYFQEPDVFPGAPEFAKGLESYARQLVLPVKENARVIEVARDEEQDRFVVTVNEKEGQKKYHCRQLVVASGSQNKPLIPLFATNIDKGIFQLHASEYKNAAALPAGNVLVVGSAQSGTQIAEDLVLTKNKVYLSTGKVGRIPRRYRGKDTLDWLVESGFYSLTKDQVRDPAMLKMKPPQVSGIGERGRTTSLQSLSKQGVMILGRADHADKENIYFQPDAAEHIKFADNFSMNIKTLIDDFIQQKNIAAPRYAVDKNDLPDSNASCASAIRKLNFKESNITSIIWATGFTGDFSYLKLPVINEEKAPIYQDGVSPVKGLYFIGLPWLRTRGSVVIFGTSDDAQFIANKIHETR